MKTLMKVLDGERDTFGFLCFVFGMVLFVGGSDVEIAADASRFMLMGVTIFLLGITVMGVVSMPRLMAGMVIAGFIGLNLMLSGCAMPRNIRQAEVSRNAVLNNPQLRSGSVFLDVNPYTCTWVVDRVYRGQLTREQAIGNINGRVVFFNDYLFKVELTNAITYNLENSPSVPNVARLVLDPNTTYTVVRYVGWGRSIFQKDYSLEVFTIRTSQDAVGQCWTDKWGRSECANVVSVATGSNEASYSRLDLNFQVNGTQLGRDAIGTLLETGRRR